MLVSGCKQFYAKYGNWTKPEPDEEEHQGQILIYYVQQVYHYPICSVQSSSDSAMPVHYRWCKKEIISEWCNKND